MTLTSKLLIYLGTLPFIFISILIAIKYKGLLDYGITNIEAIISIYAIAIISFISGSHWGLNFKLKSLLSSLILISSNITVISIWLAYLFLIFEIFIFVASVAFIILLFIDKKLLDEAFYTRKYFQTRLIATSIVLLSFCLMLYHTVFVALY